MHLPHNLPLLKKTDPSQLAGAGTAHGLMRTCTLHALMPMETMVMNPHARAKMMPASMELMIRKPASGMLTRMVVTIPDSALELVPGNGTVLLMTQETLSNASASVSTKSPLMIMVTSTGLIPASTTTAKAHGETPLMVQ